MILGVIAFYIVDVCVGNYYVSAVFKIRALFRMFKITILIINIIQPRLSMKSNKVESFKRSMTNAELVTDILERMKKKADSNSLVILDQKQI